jgi:hypothetical protein
MAKKIKYFSDPPPPGRGAKNGFFRPKLAPLIFTDPAKNGPWVLGGGQLRAQMGPTGAVNDSR